MDRMERRTRFPAVGRGYAMALEDHPIEIDGMRVVFDEKVALFPIRVARKKKQVRPRVDR